MGPQGNLCVQPITRPRRARHRGRYGDIDRAVDIVLKKRCGVADGFADFNEGGAMKDFYRSGLDDGLGNVRLVSDVAFDKGAPLNKGAMAVGEIVADDEAKAALVKRLGDMRVDKPGAAADDDSIIHL
jgi:hypothetical protein